MTALAEPAATVHAPPDTVPRGPRQVWLPVLLVGTAALYLWDLGASGWANTFYSAAVQAGTRSWTAFLFGSSDAANAITVDKPPASLWVMELSARLFGVNAWSILVPQALAGVAAVWLLYATVKRCASPGAGLLAGAALAVTPVATLMFRFNNPDALLVLLLVLAAYATVRALEHASTWWLALAGAALGFGFLTKMFQAFLVLPAIALVYAYAAPTGPARRIRQILLAGVALLVSGGWWVALVALWPASARPYIGGSQHNSVLELAFGYNGFGRLTGDETGGLGNLNGDAGWARLVGADMGTQIAWLLPAAIIGLAAALWLTHRTHRTNLTRAAALLWGGWLIVTAAVFSFAQGILHPYYTVALAPAIAALVGIGATGLWRHRTRPAALGVLSGGIALTAMWSYVLLDRDSTWHPWIRITVLVLGLITAILILIPGRIALVLAVVVALLGPASYSVATAAVPHTGAIPSAGPTSGFTPNMGGLLDGVTPGTGLTNLLSANASRYTWVAATIGSNNAAGYQLATGDPVMAIGGFNGTDPSPTLAEFEQYVAQGRIHYFIAGDNAMPGRATSGSQDASRITEWVSANFTSSTVDGVTIYDLVTR